MDTAFIFCFSSTYIKIPILCQNYEHFADEIPLAVPVLDRNHYPVVSQLPRDVITQNILEHSVVDVDDESPSEDSEPEEAFDLPEDPDHHDNNPNAGPAAGKRRVRQEEMEISLLKINIHSREEHQEIYP